ncbi:MAG: hypothetical protein HW388_1472 [Dehalococcoidia bacterium]|nr:hypothetical protein [Dehalococcoidia bacterium]
MWVWAAPSGAQEIDTVKEQCYSNAIRWRACDEGRGL